MTVYKIQRPDGSTEYTSTPQGEGRISTINRNGTTTTVRERERTAAEQNGDVKYLIKQAQARGAKLADYLDYLSYLRHNSPVRFDRVMRELRVEDPETWMKLQKFPQFRPLRESTIGLKAGANIMGASAGLANGKFGGSMEKWMESTLKDLMKRDRWGPYADVLGDKASTLPGKTQTYSNSRLGQYMKAENAEAAVASARSMKEMAGTQAALRAAKGTAVVRSLGPVVDLGIAALNPETFSASAIFVLRVRMDKLKAKDILSDDDYFVARDLLSQSKFGELGRHLDQAEKSYIQGGPK